MATKKQLKKSKKRSKRAEKPAPPCYHPHLNSSKTNGNYQPHIHVNMVDYAGRPITIWWENTNGVG